jgi:hypothetical protein
MNSLLENQSFRKKAQYNKNNDKDKHLSISLNINSNHDINKDIIKNIEKSINDLLLREYVIVEKKLKVKDTVENPETVKLRKRVLFS